MDEFFLHGKTVISSHGHRIVPQSLPKDVNLKDKPDICGSCCGIFSLDSGAVLERETQTFGLKPRPEADEMPR